MQEASYNAYVRISSVGPMKANGTTNRRQQPLYNVSATGTVQLGRQYNEQTNSYDDIIREVDIEFVDMVENLGRLLAVDCEIYINGGHASSYNVNLGYNSNITNVLTGIEHNGVTAVPELLEQMAQHFGNNQNKAQILEALKQLVPATIRRTSIYVKPLQWRITAHPSQVQTAQVVDFAGIEVLS